MFTYILSLVTIISVVMYLRDVFGKNAHLWLAAALVAGLWALYRMP